MDIEKAIGKLEGAIRDLKLQYELFFKGEIRRAPFSERQRLHQMVIKLQAMHMTNTQVKFKVKTLASSFLSQCRFWDRIMLQIENGTYRPDRFKAEYRESTRDEKIAEKAATPPKTDINERNLRNLYHQFIEARRSTGESTKVSFDAFSNSIEKQKPALEKRLGRDAGFKVVVEGGKTKLKGV
jgi:hypothetical protein